MSYSKITFLYPEETEEAYENVNMPVPKPQTCQILTFDSASNPSAWGPSYWTSLHIMSYFYPAKASNIQRDRMVQRILAISNELPCVECQQHSSAYIQKYFKQLPDICSGRDKLFAFFVDFHNQVNKRYGKKVYTVEEAKKLYSGKFQRAVIV